MSTTALTERRHRLGWIFAAVWLFYLGQSLSALLHQPAGWPRYVGLGALVGFAALYLALVNWLSGLRHGRIPRSTETVVQVWSGIVALLGLAVLQLPGAGEHALTCLVYIAAVGVIGLPRTHGVSLAAVLVVAAEVLTHTMPGWHDNGYGLGVFLAAVATWGIRLAAERQARLVQAQGEIAALAVATERARIAADLHDILGHSLTVVTVKAELAQRLLDVDLDRARAELRDLETLARDAMSDVRSTALGVRGISLPGEIAAARSALAAANVTADLPGAADEVPTRWRELFAWTIREAVTNIVRHSSATRCEVRLSPHSVEILDDGVGTDPGSGGDGQGLRGLRRRVDALGAELHVGRRDDRPGFRVRVEVPT